MRTELKHAILWVCTMGAAAWGQTGHRTAITAPPPELSADGFYQKYLDCGGISVKSSAKVEDRALYRVEALLQQMLANRPDLHQALADSGVSYVIIGATQEVTEIPEYSRMEPKAFWNERARGFGGKTTSCGEENLLNLPFDRYSDESIFIHELAHAIHGYGLRKIDSGFDGRLKALYEAAMARGLWKNDYASTNHSEYWAEAVQSFFDCNRENNWNHNDINTRAELMAYDPDIAALVREEFRITDENDWRFEPVARQPSVLVTPQGVADESHLVKYVWCRGLAILGSESVADEALLKAYDVIYALFRYRHDMLKSMIENGLQVVVTSGDETETQKSSILSHSVNNRQIKQQLVSGTIPARVYVTLPQQNLLAKKRASRSAVVYQMALASGLFTGLRQEDPQWTQRKNVQQYELGLERMDARFDRKLNGVFEQSADKKSNDAAGQPLARFDYWARGVCAFFNAGPVDMAGKTIRNRAGLQRLDPELAALVGDVFKHPERTDWLLP